MTSQRTVSILNVQNYHQKVKQAVNDYGQAVEEFEIQFVDGEAIDCELAQALGLHQGSFDAFLKFCQELDDHDKVFLIVAIGECESDFAPGGTSPHEFEVDLYEMGSLRELAEYFVNEGIMGEIPDNLLLYFDYGAFAWNLAADYSEIMIAGSRYIYQCG